MSEVDREQLACLGQEELVSKALSALQNDHTYLAMACLQQAEALGSSSIIDSYLGYCLALNHQDFPSAIRLGLSALHQEPNNPLFCLNLGRVYLMAGEKTDAVRVFRQGLAFSRDEQLIAELNRLGTRKPPVIVFLHRDNFINVLLGKLLVKLGLR